MKSKIMIALDQDNQPIIKIDYAYSEDVRDDMVKRFMQHFGGDSSWAHFQYVSCNDDNTICKIRPIPVKEIEVQSKEMIDRLSKIKA